MGIPVIERKLHSHAFRDLYEHYETLCGSPHPYDSYGAPDQKFEVLQPHISSIDLAGCDWFKHSDPLKGHPSPYNFYGATTQRIEVL
jgi:hypothetical protein